MEGGGREVVREREGEGARVNIVQSNPTLLCTSILVYLEVPHKEVDSFIFASVFLNGRVDTGQEGVHLVGIPYVHSLKQLVESLQTQDRH